MDYISNKDLKEAIMRVLGIAIIRDPITLTLKQLKDIIAILPSTTGDFPITSVSRVDLAACGFDAEKISDENMEELADKMEDDYCEQMFYESMKEAAGYLNLPKTITPMDMETALIDLGYEQEYLDSLTNTQLKDLYEEKTKDE